MSNSLQPHGLYSPWNSPGWNTGVGSLSPLLGIFPTWGSNPCLPYCRQVLYQLSHKGSPKKGDTKERCFILGRRLYLSTGLCWTQVCVCVKDLQRSPGIGSTRISWSDRILAAERNLGHMTQGSLLFSK